MEDLLAPSDAIAMTTNPLGAPPVRRPGVFNAGVTSDTTMNLIYRLQGSGAEEIYQNPYMPNILEYPELQGLFKALGSETAVKLWVVHIGANDLRAGHQWDPIPLYVLLELLFRNSAADAKVLLTGLFYVSTVPDAYTDRVNEQYRRAAQYFGGRYGAHRIRFLRAPWGFHAPIHVRPGPHIEGMHCEDLSWAGYKMWMKFLVPTMWQMVDGSDDAYAVPKPKPPAPPREEVIERRWI